MSALDRGCTIAATTVKRQLEAFPRLERCVQIPHHFWAEHLAFRPNRSFVICQLTTSEIRSQYLRVSVP